MARSRRSRRKLRDNTTASTGTLVVQANDSFSLAYSRDCGRVEVDLTLTATTTGLTTPGDINVTTKGRSSYAIGGSRGNANAAALNIPNSGVAGLNRDVTTRNIESVCDLWDLNEDVTSIVRSGCART